jgi:acyl transferase domain-containing protein/alpha-ketoglutarate-dependent taurine dioxygenase
MQDSVNKPGPEDLGENAVAVIGYAARFPLAASVREFWRNLCDEVDSVKHFDDEQLVSMGIEREHLAAGNHTRAGAMLEDADDFDAGFFGYSASEAEVMDPQHRIFLECCWEALEDAGYDVSRYKGMVGVYAGASPDAYLLNLYLQGHTLVRESPLQLQVANGPWSLTTRVSYKLNLRGPSFFVQTACSTSLVAVHLACQSLLAYECHMALAGGVSVVYPQATGFCFEGGGISAPSERCRAFDKDADGTVFGQGSGVVVLKRLEEALAAGDSIRAVIRGSALNNDGLNKVGFTAPGVDGQAAVISAALARAEVDPATVSYIETHGTGTQLGDPIEIRALLKAFGKRTRGPHSCAIGSVKTNIGHLDAAAGVAGLIKTVLSLEHGLLPPSLHYRRPNPEIDFASGPFYVNTELREWKESPRRAGVSSFGFGGTNAHLVLEEAPARRVPDRSRAWQLLVVSARTPTALDAACSNLVSHLREHRQAHLPDLAYTLQTGRKSFKHRRALVCRSKEDAIERLRESLGTETPTTQETEPALAFLFPGQGTQHLHMAQGLYEQEPIFREELDSCAALCERESGEDLKRLLFSDAAGAAAEKLRQTSFAQPALFAVEYALSKLWMAWGVEPSAMLGHSLGEYTAACLAGVFTLEEAAHLVVQRGLLAQQAQPGRMLAVMLPEDELLRRLPEELSLAAVNAPQSCVVSGVTEVVEALEAKLLAEGIGCVRLQTSHAFHSRLMRPLVPLLADALRRVTLRPPRIPFVSNVTGTWITTEQATSVDYWTTHLTDTVRFADGVRALRERANLVCLEVGPGRTLSGFVRAVAGTEHVPTLFSLPRRESNEEDQRQVLSALGELWQHRARVNWAGFYRNEKRSRISLPTYPFERSRYRAEAASGPKPLAARSVEAASTPPVGWFYAPSWRRGERLEPVRDEQLSARADRWLLLIDEDEPIGLQLAERLKSAGQDVSIVCPGESFARLEARRFVIDPKAEGDFGQLLDALEETGGTPDRIVHLWSVTDGAGCDPLRDWEESQYRGLYSLLSLARALSASKSVRPRRLWVLTTGALSVLGDEALRPERATMLGPCQVLPVEDPSLNCRFLDFVPDRPASESAARLLGEIVRGGPDVIALRGDYVWERHFEPVSLSTRKDFNPFRERGVYLITGGLGGIGLSLARHLAERSHARLALVGRTPLPERASWEELSAHGRDDRTAKQLRRLIEIEKLGAEVLTLTADVCSLEEMSAVVAETVRRFGAINGVVHAAGVPDRGSFYEKQYGDMRSVLAPKVEGTLVLDRLLEDAGLDFFVLCSSVSSFARAYGESVYAGANAFLDTFAHASMQSGRTPVVSVNWGAWQEVGMAAEAHVPEQFREFANRQLKKGLMPREGSSALEQILADTGRRRQVIVSKVGLTELLEGGPLAEMAAMLEQPPARAAATPPSRHPRPSIESKYLAPETELEQMIAGVWQDILGIDGVGLNDGFFELGGNSLVATQLATRLRNRVGREVPVRVLFEAGTVAGLAQWFEASADSNSRPQPPALAKATAPLDAPPLSYEQEHLWFHYQLEPDSLAYNVPFAVRLEGPLNFPLARRALAEITRRHDTLRSTFDDIDGSPVQSVAPTVEVALSVIDISELWTEGRDLLSSNLIRECLGRPFDLKHGPLFRTTILRLGPDRHVLLADLHHIIADNWSALILVREFMALYAAYQEGQPPALGELPIQYGDYASWQKQYLSGDRLQELLTYWKGRLANLPQLRLRDENPSAAEQSGEGGTVSLSIDGELFESLRAMSRQENVTLFMVLLAAYVTTLREFGGQDDIVVGADVSSRSQPELEELIGFFINMLVLRADVSGNPTFRELLVRVREIVSAAKAHQELPFGKLVQELNPRKGRGQSPLFRAVLNYQNAPQEELRLPGLTITPMPVEESVARFDLSLSVTETAERLEGTLRYKRGVIGDELARRIKGCFVGVLEAVAANPRSTVDELGLYTRRLHPGVERDRKTGDARPAGRFVASRRPVVVSPRHLLNSHLLYPDAGLPLLVEPAVKDLDAVSWLKANTAKVQGWLDDHGAVLFRGFAVNDSDAFRDFVTAISPELLGYNERAAPRIEVSPKIFTSTEYPPEYLVPLHNEMAFSHEWPMKICFCCIIPARQGGATPIASSSRVYELIEPRVRELFVEKNVMYVRNFGQGIDLSWQETFQTESREVVEQQCRRAGMRWLWREDDGLKTWRVAPPVVRHPRTGKLLWFNNAHVFHVSTNDAQTRAALLAQCEEEDLPRQTFYGDGTPIEDSVLEQIREAYRSAAVRFDWQAGDVLMLDNMAVCHGRETFVGPRKILVALAEPTGAQG